MPVASPSPIGPIGNPERWLIKKPIHPRRAHAKSRSGCQPCKLAKLKCDEERPECRRCSTRHYRCCYRGQPGNQLSTSSKTSKLSLHSHLQPMILAGTEAELWYHFTTCTWATLADPCVNTVVKQSLGLAFQHEHLKYAVLALAATHQRFLRANEQSDSLVEQHLWKAITLFRSRLTTPPTSSTMDAVLLTSHMLSTQNLFLHRLEPSGSWSPKGSDGLGWLTLLSGWRTMLLQHKSWLTTSIWAKTVQQTPSSSRITLQPTPRLEKAMFDTIPIDWRIAFGISEDEEELDSNPYGKALYDLAALVAREDRTRPLTHVMTFAYRLDPKLLTLLHKRDPSAICIIAIWLGCLCQVDLWWVARQARLECYAACEYLETCASDAQRLLLDSTARACGYSFLSSETHCPVNFSD